MPTKSVYQFKVTLNGSGPPIWRRIRVRNCTLDKLHEHIQTVMGWTNSHLHQFEIDGFFYADPELLQEDMIENDYLDSTITRLSDVMPDDGSTFHFLYEYDFGDGWVHEITFEGFKPAEHRKRYPVCVDGERACPPEEIGGIWGYDEYLEALGNADHEDDEVSPFDPEAFDARQTTKRMRRGLPDWREANGVGQR